MLCSAARQRSKGMHPTDLESCDAVLRKSSMDGEFRSDVEIRQAIQNALEVVFGASSAQIRYAVSTGQVTLEGSVSGLEQRALIERVVRIFAGVSCVFNRIQISAL